MPPEKGSNNEEEFKQVLEAIHELRESSLKNLKDELTILTARQMEIKIDVTSINNKIDLSIVPRLEGLHKCIKGNGKIGLEDKVTLQGEKLDKMEESMRRVGDQVRSHDGDIKNMKPEIMEKKIEKKYFVGAIVLLGSVVGSVLTLIAAFAVTPMWKGIVHFFTGK